MDHSDSAELLCIILMTQKLIFANEVEPEEYVHLQILNTPQKPLIFFRRGTFQYFLVNSSNPPPLRAHPHNKFSAIYNPVACSLGDMSRILVQNLKGPSVSDPYVK